MINDISYSKENAIGHNRAVRQSLPSGVSKRRGVLLPAAAQMHPLPFVSPDGPRSPFYSVPAQSARSHFATVRDMERWHKSRKILNIIFKYVATIDWLYIVSLFETIISEAVRPMEIIDLEK